MQVYIEQVFLNNFVLDFMLLILTSLCVRQKLNYYRLIVASVLGAIISIVLPLSDLYGIYLTTVKVILGVIISLIACKSKSFKTNFLFFVMFLTFTFVFGGMCFAMILCFGGEINSMTVDLPLPLWVILGIVLIYGFIISKAIKCFYNKQKFSKFNYNICLIINGKTLKINAYLDSGNTLVDNKTKKGVIVINFKTFCKLKKNINVVDILLKKQIQDLKNSHYISYDTISGKGNMLVFEPDDIFEIKSKKKLDAVIGVSIKGLKQGQFDALLSPLVFN